MNRTREDCAMTALRWSLGIGVGWESIFTAWTAFPEVHGSGRYAAHAWIRLILGSVETIGAILFLLPQTVRLGGWILVAVFSFAILFHALQGEFNAGLIIYAAATIACVVHTGRHAS
jgi:uncharacterized membrane protein YphA (DoxX/SURF4 family)